MIAGGSCDSKVGSILLTASTISIVLVPGWRCTASMMPRVPLYQAAILSFCTLFEDAADLVQAHRARRCGRRRSSARRPPAFISCPVACTEVALSRP